MLSGGCGCVDGGYARNLGVFQEKLYCVGVLLGPGVGNIDAITARMVYFRAEVLPISALGCPRRAFVGFFVHHDLRDWGSLRSFVVVKRPL